MIELGESPKKQKPVKLDSKSIQKAMKNKMSKSNNLR